MNYTKIMLDNLEHSVIVRKCLEKGANVHVWDNEALRYASFNGYKEIIKLLEQYTDKTNNNKENIK